MFAMDRLEQEKGLPRVLVIVPAHNESTTIAGVLRALSVHAPWADVVIVDDGSTDGTAAIAAEAGGRVLQLPFNLGVGGAMQTGYLYAHQRGYDIAVQFDGDGQHRADQIVSLVQEVDGGGADLVIGSRLVGRRSYRFSPLRWIGSRLLAGMLSVVAGVRISDPTSGFRAVSRKMLGFFAKHYPQTYLGDTVEALAIAAKHGMSVRELPARIRMTNQKKIGSVVGLWHTLRVCLAILINRAERKFPEVLSAQSEQKENEP